MAARQAAGARCAGGIEPEQNKEFGPHYKLIGCDDDTDNTFWFSSIAVGAESKYYGEKLEIAELIHLRVRYIEEGDLVKYQSLLHKKKSPISSIRFRTRKISGVQGRRNSSHYRH
ncbi:hypothetical protein OMP38_10015 [Cohnella ginsengisoli]|uniref:Uncharacterized protein n=1 Tax=Cohnella ginsengisoli TaxID=425004 RepID=A0A9X4KGM3_9BACL|nr:hypothetical protein [Cohnella ginsengisoli]MDG0791169.1 hypothetical protein [Cohnella ginsengisoli]